jgi:hypothetical protein
MTVVTISPGNLDGLPSASTIIQLPFWRKTWYNLATVNAGKYQAA